MVPDHVQDASVDGDFDGDGDDEDGDGDDKAHDADDLVVGGTFSRASSKRVQLE